MQGTVKNVLADVKENNTELSIKYIESIRYKSSNPRQWISQLLTAKGQRSQYTTSLVTMVTSNVYVYK